MPTFPLLAGTAAGYRQRLGLTRESTMERMKWIVSVAALAAACDSGAGDDGVDSTSAELVTTTPLSCGVEGEYDVYPTSGSADFQRYQYWAAFVGAPPVDAEVTFLLCDRMDVGPPFMCPGFFCMGRRPERPVCQKTANYDIVTNARARVSCGFVLEQRRGDALVSAAGEHWLTVSMTVRQ